MSDVRIKICGLTRIEDASLATELGAWALGFIFYPPSPRYIEPKKVAQILEQLKNSTIKSVGVFVNPTLNELKDVVATSKINTIQLHGNESAEFCEEVKKTFPLLEMIKAIRIDEPQKSTSLTDYQLIDSISDQAWGGTGKTVDWEKAAKIAGKPVILAGGINPENILKAMKEVKPFALDVSSGVETSPGVKSAQKLRELFKATQGIL